MSIQEIATIVRTEDRRTTAEISNDTIRAPQVYVLADEGAYGDVIEAVARAVAAEPNALNAPAVRARDADEFGALTFTFRPNELPAIGPGGGLEGWMAPYRAEEKVRARLREHLPAGWTFETERQGVLVLFEE